MIPYHIDPSLHSGAPEPALLDDGFSPPPRAPEPAPLAPGDAVVDVRSAVPPRRQP